DCFLIRRKFSLGDLAEDLAEFCDYLCLERPFVVGVSFGAVLALEYAIRFPHRLAGLAFQGGDVRFKPTLIRRIASHVLSGYPLPPDSPFVNQFFNLLFGGRQKDRELFDFVTRQSWLTDQGVMARRFHLAEKVELSNRLSRIAVPTLAM